jgi:hypothetical protein
MSLLQAKKAVAGQLASVSTTPQTDADDMFSFQHTWAKTADDGMASTTTAEGHIGLVVPFACRLRSAKYVATTGGITAHATNYATLVVRKRDSAYASATTIASFATDTVTTDDVTQNVPKSMGDVAAGGLSIAAGSCITIEITKAGSGVVVRQGFVILEFVKESSS